MRDDWCRCLISMGIISKLWVDNGYDTAAHNLRLEHAKNAGFDSKHIFCYTPLHGNTNTIKIF